MSRKTKLQQLLKALSPDRTSVDFSELDKSIEQFKQGVKQKIEIATIDEVTRKIDKFRKELDIKPVMDAVETIERGYSERMGELSDILDDELNKLRQEIEDNRPDSDIQKLRESVEFIQSRIDSLGDESVQTITPIKSALADLDAYAKSCMEKCEQMADQALADKAEMIRKHDVIGFEMNNKLGEVNKSLEAFRQEFLSRLGNIGGGNQNRNIAIGGNPSVLSKYTDINLKAGNNVTITYQNNDTTKQVDVTISATGGSGSVGGTVRSINRVSTSQTMGSVAGTDYVYIADQGIRLTLPDATGITNLYTIKNVSASSVLVSTTAAQTIDTDSELILATQYTSVDLINDGADDWSIT